MRNLSEKWWMKCIAIILCIAGVIMGAASLVAMFYDADYPKGELLDSIYERIADNYAAKILEDYNDSADEADFFEKSGKRHRSAASFCNRKKQ
jgi:hypothetical protein